MNNDQASSGIFILLGSVISAASVGHGLGTFSTPDSGFMPFLTGVAMCLLGAIGMVDATLRRRKGERWQPMIRHLLWQRGVIVLAALIGYVLLLKVLGFLLCTVLFVGLLLKAVIPQRWPLVIAGALLSAGVTYAVFELWLQAQLPKGFFGY